jgi:hypothetical protein
VNGRQTAAAEKILDHKRAVHLVDGVTIRAALLGNEVALTELEHDAVISICDVDGMDRDLVRRGLGISRSTLDKAITARRTARPAAERQALATALIEPALDLLAAVRNWDAEAVADVLAQFAGMNLTGWHAFAIVLADMASSESGGLGDDR